ncbi:MAG: molecular chaperone DnaJ [Clostridiaceae bacterium]|jgi:molecular chaperone DnaJ|nr:molecular chaperone DnaJ [Clostridiaceae bacterium]
MDKKDYYKILGISEGADADAVKAAYRKMAKENHPDVFATAGEAEKKKAEARFKKINEAYEVLSDEQKRAAYDRFGDENGPVPGAGGFGAGDFSSGFGGGGASNFGGYETSGGINLEDLISSIFGGGFTGRSSGAARNAPQVGQDIVTDVTISFEEAASGVEKELSVRRDEKCPDCKGSGAKDGTSVKTCPKCGGKGAVNTVKNTPFGQFSSATTCSQCGGRGKIITEPCKTCGGKGRFAKSRIIKVNIPAGIDDGQTMTMYNEGNAGVNGGDNGSLLIRVRVKAHRIFERKGADLYVDLPISFVQASLGCTVSLKVLDKTIGLDIPAGTQSGTTFKLRGEGLKRLRVDGKGDLYVKIIVEIPRNLDKRQRELLNELDGSFEGKQYPQIKSFKDKQQ